MNKIRQCIAIVLLSGVLALTFASIRPCYNRITSTQGISDNTVEEITTIIPNDETTTETVEPTTEEETTTEGKETETTTEEETVPIDQVQTTSKYVELTDKEIRDLAALIYLEGRGESYETQQAICAAIINRYTLSQKGIAYTYCKTLHDIMYDEDQFSPAGGIPHTTPADTQFAVVYDMIYNGPSLPEYIVFFRSGYYHQWDNERYIPWLKMEDIYFTCDLVIYEKWLRYMRTNGFLEAE